MATTDEDIAYATYEEWDENPLRCLNYLVENNELIWKLLKYNTADAWKNESDGGYPNLTKDEKSALIYKGDGQYNLEDYSVFLDIGQDQSITFQKSFLRMTNYSLVPDNRTWGVATIIFEIYSHYEINQMSNQRTRVDMIMQQLIKTYNGKKDVFKGVGKFYFNKSGTAPDRIEVSGQIPFRGKWMLMSQKVA